MMDNLIEQAIRGKKKFESSPRFEISVSDNTVRGQAQAVLNGQIVSTKFKQISLKEESAEIFLHAILCMLEGEWREASINALAIERLENL